MRYVLESGTRRVGGSVKLMTEIVFRNRGGGDEVRGEDEERRREDED
jgi:hypothetical protein